MKIIDTEKQESYREMLERVMTDCPELDIQLFASTLAYHYDEQAEQVLRLRALNSSLGEGPRAYFSSGQLSKHIKN